MLQSNSSSYSPDVVGPVVLFSEVVCTVLVSLGVEVYTVVEVTSTVLVGLSVVVGDTVVTFVVSTVVVASVSVDSVPSNKQHSYLLTISQGCEMPGCHPQTKPLPILNDQVKRIREKNSTLNISLKRCDRSNHTCLDLPVLFQNTFSYQLRR